MTTCPSCATVLELDAAFCGQCGARVRARRRTLVGAELDGRFRVDAKIAEGGFGSIYRATHLASGHAVALKVLHAELAADDNLAARFRREGETLSMLSSPHTVSVFEVGETDDGTLYIAMELLHGQSLLERFRAHGPLPWRGVLEIMKQVCRSLGEAHALGIIHRDLKPANIHLETNEHVKVLDFGIAKLMRGSDSDDGNDLTRVGQAVGTLEYMSPEQLIGATCDGRADIYALGVVVYEMLTGRRPYADATGPTSLVAAVMTQPLVPPSRLFDGACVPVDVDHLVLRCLAKEPKDRYASVGELIEAIDAILAPLARGSWSTELMDEETTWLDGPPAAPALPQVIITPSRQPVLHAGGVGFENTHMQAAIAPATNPGLGTPSRQPITPSRAPTDVASPTSRGLARGSSSPVSPYARARRQSDLELEAFSSPIAPLAEGSRVRQRPTPVPAKGSRVRQRPTPVPAKGSRVRHPMAPPAPPAPSSLPLVDIARSTEPAPTGSLPLVDIARSTEPAPPAPTGARIASNAPVTDTPRVRRLGVVRVALWTVGLLAGGAGVGMLIAALVG